MKKTLLLTIITILLTPNFCLAVTAEASVSIKPPELFLPLVSSDTELDIKTSVQEGKVVYEVKKVSQLTKVLENKEKNKQQNGDFSFKIYDHKLYLDSYIVDYKDLMDIPDFRNKEGGLFKFKLKTTDNQKLDYQLVPGITYAILKFSGNKSGIFGYGEHSIIPVYSDIIVEEGRLHLVRDDQIFLVNLLPQSLENKIEEISLNNPELKIKEVYMTVEDYRAAYIVRVTEKMKLFGLFPVAKELTYKIDAKKNELFNYQRPWYLSHGSFFKSWK